MSRQHFFIKPKVQLKYLLRIAGVVVITSFVLYVFLRNEINSGLAGVLDKPALADFSWALTKTFVVVTLVMVLMFCLHMLFTVHSLAGAIYALERIIKSVAEGNLKTTMQTRKGDELKDTVVQLQNMAGKLSNLVYDDRLKVQEAKQLCEQLKKTPLDSAAAEKLKELESKIAQITMQFKI